MSNLFQSWRCFQNELVSPGANNRSRVFVSFLLLAVFCSQGCMLSAIEGRGKKITIDRQTTEQKLRREFGNPIRIEQFDPPKQISELPVFKGHFTESGQRLEYHHSLEPDLPVAKLHTYRYIGRTAVDQSQIAGMELAFGVMSLGITEILLIPEMIESLSDDSRDDEITDFAVAFDEDGNSLARTFVRQSSSGGE